MGTERWKGQIFTKEDGENAASCIGWGNATAFCKALAKKTGKPIRLPTEAEGEYACRAGTTTRFSFGDDDSKLGDYAWHEKNAWDVGEKYAHPVGQKKSNPWGLHDMHGNVSEWCSDWYDEKYYSARGNTVDPKGAASGELRVLRGGSFRSLSRYCRAAYRGRFFPGRRRLYSGFRVLVVSGSAND
jgi:formylglycine-generating enzyme required for sulfatase activity